MDVNNAFLHEFLEEEIYMRTPPGLPNVLPGQVCKLRKSLYGLKQASRQWNIELTKFLISLGFVQSRHDHSLFTMITASSFIAALIYVDDILMTGDSISVMDTVKQALHAKFTIKDLGVATYFLGMEIYKTPTGIFINQRKYILDIITALIFLIYLCPVHLFLQG